MFSRTDLEWAWIIICIALMLGGLIMMAVGVLIGAVIW